MPETPSTFKRSHKPTKRYEEMKQVVQEQRLRVDLEPPVRGKNALLKARLLAAEPEILPPPLPSTVTKTGYYGVVRASANDHGHRNRKPYQARIPVGKANWVHLGSFNTAEEAGRHAAAAHNALLEGLLPRLVEVPVDPPPPAKPRCRNSRIHKPTPAKWTEDEDEQMLQILSSPEFDTPLNRSGGILGGTSKTGLGDESYWRRVAEAMGYGNSVKGARRCSRRWWYLNPKNAERIEEKRKHERERAKGKGKARAASQKCLVDILEDVVFEVDEDPFESALAVTEDVAPVEEAQNVIVRLSQLKEPIDAPKEIDLYADEMLSDITVERCSCSDLSELSILDDLNNLHGFYEADSLGGFSTRVVKRTKTPSTKARKMTFTFQRSNLGRIVFTQANQHRKPLSKYTYQKRHRELKKREAFDSIWRATNYNSSLRANDAAWREAREAFNADTTPPTPTPLLPVPEPPLLDATLALVQERMQTYLKACKPTLATGEVHWAMAKASPVQMAV